MTEKTDLRVKKTYMALNKSFEELLKHKDFCDITVNEICENAMVSRGTFYIHFTGKYDFSSFFLCKKVTDCLNKTQDETHTDNLCEYYKTFFNNFIETLKAYNYNFKLADNSTAMGIAFSPVNNAYNMLLSKLQVCYPDNYKLNRFMAKYLAVALILIIFDLTQNDNHSSDEIKESMSVLLEKLFAYE
ncbi:MAG: TetR/AcrR family transcriptional regulator [Clostridiales bacterium]|nr:TetR/AcrR family transcriptional regulator [Clostridiales bacterium]